MAKTEMKIDRLRCEYLENPLGIDVERPRLSWVLKSMTRGEMQKAYQVLVGTSEVALEKDEGDIWDSGKVESDQSIQVEYGGRKLRSEEACFWKARVWHRDGSPSEWSETAFWTMGLLEDSDWKAKWIARTAEIPPEDILPKTLRTREPDAESLLTQSVPSPIFRKELSIQKPVRRAFAYTCGLGYFELRVNGEKVGRDTLEPGFTRYDKRALYVTRDFTPLLKQGENALGVMLGNGWFNTHARCVWDMDRVVWRNTPRLLLQLHIEYEDGSDELVTTDETWKTATGPVVFDGIRNGEVYDARLERPGWDTAGYRADDWQPALIVESPTHRLVSQKTLPIRGTKTIRPISVTEPKPGVFIFDMGQNFAGHGRLSVSGPRGTEITIRYDERLDDNGLLDNENASLLYSGKFQAETYILKGEGVEVWEPRFMYSGFRYAQMEGFPGTPTADNLLGVVVHTDFERIGSFECSNELINRIHTNGLWSYVSNFVGYPTDCPQREKNGWTGDAHLASEMGLYNFSSEASYTKWMDDIRDTQKDSGEIPAVVPTDTWGYNIGPAWDSAYILIPWYMRLYRGDTRVLEEHYESHKRMVEAFTSKAEGHIVDYGLGDWLPPVGEAQQHRSPRGLTGTACYYVDALILSKMARMLGRNDDEKHYGELARQIRKAFNEKYYDAERGICALGDQTSMSAALYQGLVPPGDEQKVLANLLKEVERCEGHLDCGILGTKYLLHALTDNGRPDVAYSVATKKTFPSWGYWIELGATTHWECWYRQHSLNHVMLGDVGAWFYEALAGINPDPEQPGFKHIIIRPRPVGDLTWVRAQHMSPYGLIRSSWSLDGGRFRLDLEIPANTTAEVWVPAKDISAVMESGSPASKSEGVEFLRMEDDSAVFSVGSGSYHFEA